MAETTKTPGAFDPAGKLDGLLVRYLDGELSGSDDREAAAVIESSHEARERLADLRSSSDLLTDRLGDLPIPAVPEISMGAVPEPSMGADPEAEPAAPDPSMGAVPGIPAPEISDTDVSKRARPGNRSPFTSSSFFRQHRIAAGIVLLLLAVSLIAPVRAWIVESVRNVASMVAPSEQLPELERGVEAGPSAVSFVPLGEELVVSVGGYQAAGRLTVVVVEGSRASGEASIQEAGVELLVLPRGIEVRNGPSSLADYTIAVPSSLRRVRVLVGGRELGVGTPGEVEVGHTWVFELFDEGG